MSPEWEIGAPELMQRVAALERETAALRRELEAQAAAIAGVSRSDGQRLVTSSTKAAARDASIPVSTPPVSTPPVSTPTFGGMVRERGDLESQFGAKVLSKVAIVLLLVGAAWFLKWAFDNRWIGALGRVLIGLAAGAGVIVWSERFRRSGTPGFSYALKAVGSGVLYLSLWASFQVYHQVPAAVALLLMLGVTAWNATLAITQESRLLAAYALLGAYLTPALLSTGHNHELFLFSYLAMLLAAVTVLLRVRAWNVLLLAPLPVTTAYWIAWYLPFGSESGFAMTLILTLVLWAFLGAVPLVAREFEDVLAGVLQPIGTALFGALTVSTLLIEHGHRDAEPWAALSFAAAYLVASRVRRGTVVAAIHLSVSLAFVTVAIPLKLTGHGITVGWLAEAVALFWLATLPAIDKRARMAMQSLGLAALLLGTLGVLFGPWMFGNAGGPAFANRGFATSVGAAVALCAAAVLVRRSPVSEGKERALVDLIAVSSFALLNVVLLVAMGREIERALAPSEAADFVFSGWMALQGAAMLAVGFARRLAPVRWAGLLLLAATIVKTVAYDTRNLNTGYRVVSYLALGVLLMVVSFAYQKDWLHLHAMTEADNETPREQTL